MQETTENTQKTETLQPDPELMDLIPVWMNSKGDPTVNARDLHGFLGSRQKFTTWIKARINQGEFKENEDYVSLHKIMKREIGAVNKDEYHISLNMAKHLAMMEQTTRGKIVRDYFIERDQELTQREISDQIPKTLLTSKKASQFMFDLACRVEDQEDKVIKIYKEAQRIAALLDQTPTLTNQQINKIVSTALSSANTSTVTEVDKAENPDTVIDVTKSINEQTNIDDFIEAETTSVNPSDSKETRQGKLSDTLAKKIEEYREAHPSHVTAEEIAKSFGWATVTAYRHINQAGVKPAGKAGKTQFYRPTDLTAIPGYSAILFGENLEEAQKIQRDLCIKNRAEGIQKKIDERKANNPDLITRKDLAEASGTSLSHVGKLIRKRNIEPVTTVAGVDLFNKNQFKDIVFHETKFVKGKDLFE